MNMFSLDLLKEIADCYSRRCDYHLYQKRGRGKHLVTYDAFLAGSWFETMGHVGKKVAELKSVWWDT